MSKSKNSKPMPSSLARKKQPEQNKDSFYDGSEEYDSVPVMQRDSAASRPQKPNLQSHLSASMLSNTGDQGKKQQKSAVEAMIERKNSQTRSKGFFDESQPEDARLMHKKDNNKRPSTAIKKEPSPINQITGRGSRVGFDSSVKKPADSHLSHSRDIQEKTLDEKLNELAKMPSIHEMATGAYYPEPLYYHKVVSRNLRRPSTTDLMAPMHRRTTTAITSSSPTPQAHHSRSTPKPLRTNRFKQRSETSSTKIRLQSSRTPSCSTSEPPKTCCPAPASSCRWGKARCSTCCSTSSYPSSSRLRSAGASLRPEAPSPLRRSACTSRTRRCSLTQPQASKNKSASEQQTSIKSKDKATSCSKTASSVRAKSRREKEGGETWSRSTKTANRSSTKMTSNRSDKTTISSVSPTPILPKNPWPNQATNRAEASSLSRSTSSRKVAAAHPDSYPADFESNLGSAKSRKLEASESSRRPVPPSPKAVSLKPLGPTFDCSNCRKAIPIDNLKDHISSCYRKGSKPLDKLRMSVSQEGVKESMVEELINSASRSSVLRKSGSSG